MLLGLDPLLTPELLHALAAMGHGDRIVLVDSNYPATRGRRLIRQPRRGYAAGVAGGAVAAAVRHVRR
jgi:L-fucose mutarotase/ribose pyranase (RbsD/FucU family)